MEKCFCHIIDSVTGETYVVKDKEAREQIAEILAKLENYTPGEGGGSGAPGVDEEARAQLAELDAAITAEKSDRMDADGELRRYVDDSVTPYLEDKIEGTLDGLQVQIDECLKAPSSSKNVFVVGVNNGAQADFSLTASDEKWSIPYRNGTGHFYVPDATELYHPVTLNQLVTYISELKTKLKNAGIAGF